MSTNNTRTALRITRDTEVWYIHALAPLTSPSWTGDAANAKTWASPAGAMRAARAHALPTDVETVTVAR